MATASYSSTLRKLTVLGTSAAETLTIERDAVGALLVNGGTVPITGGAPTVAITDLIEVSGGDLDDIITLNEALGALPAADLFGGNGNDIVTGGFNGDRLFGDANNDTLLGKGGNDQLSGGSGNDVLTGGIGSDTMSGEGGSDRMIWNPGDGTDLMEGGTESDIAEINGGGGAEIFTIAANGARVRFDRIDPAPFLLDIGTTESLVLNAGGGDDSISTSGNLAALIALTLNGGAGNDTILGSNGIDTILGEDGIDFVDGQQGNDVAFLGADNDTFQWDPGDGSDVIEGQGGSDLIVFNGNGANEIFNFAPNGARLRSFRDVGVIVLDSDDVEAVTLNAGGGSDNIAVNDLSGTDLLELVVNLSGTIGGTAGDGQADIVSVTGDAGAETINLAGAGTALTVAGTPALVAIGQLDAASDRVDIFGGAGNDVINASTVPAGIVTLVLDGGNNDDDIRGSAGADQLSGGDGNDLVDGNQGLDTAFLGAGDDVFNWDPGDGSDVIEGQAGTDELRFNGSNANETVGIQPNGGRSNLLRDVASITMDMDDVETIRFRALGGADSIAVANMAGTEITQVIIDLAAAGGGGDGQVDSVTVQATEVADVVTVISGSINVVGLAALTRIENSEVTDRLVLSLNGGNDVLDASVLIGGQITLEVLGGLGADVVFGSAGVDLINGGDGNDTALMGAGNDVFVWNPGDDNDTLEGQDGIDRLDFNGNGSAEGITIQANGGRVLFFRDVAAVTMDLNDVEQITFNAGAGLDAIVVNDLSGTDVDTLIFNLAGAIGGTVADAQVDQITLFGDSGNEFIDLLGITGTVSVLGMPAFVSLNQLDATDLLTLNGGAGNDTINASQIAAGIVVLSINGGTGNDVINGTAGADTINAGDNDDMVDGNQGFDTVFLGNGNDRFNWNPGDGSDLVEGQAGTDELFFNGSNANENVGIFANGARISFQRDVASINMDLDDIETVTFNAIGGTDNITIGNLVGTDVTRVVVNLAGNGTDPDGLADIVTVNGTVALDSITVSLTAPGVITVSGLAWIVEIRNFDPQDRLVINGGIGNDTIDAISLPAGLGLELSGGDGNDTLRGSLGNDILHGGIGDDTMFHSGGQDYFDGGDGLLRIFG